MPKQSAVRKLDGVYGALADASRRAMVQRLARGPASVSELAGPLDMSLPAVVQHIQVLEGCGLVTSRKVGRVRTCTLHTQTMDLAMAWLGQLRAQWDARLDRLETFLEETEDE